MGNATTVPERRRNGGRQLEASGGGSNKTNVLASDGPHNSEDGVSIPPSHALHTPSALASNVLVDSTHPSERNHRRTGK